MKIVKSESIFLINGFYYDIDEEDKDIQVGTILIDGRKDQIIKLENKDDVFEYNFLAPEMYVVLKKMDSIVADSSYEAYLDVLESELSEVGVDINDFNIVEMDEEC